MISERLKARVAIDMDEVIADSFKAQLSWLNEAFDAKWDEDMFYGKELSDVLTEHQLLALETTMHKGEPDYP